MWLKLFKDTPTTKEGEKKIPTKQRQTTSPPQKSPKKKNTHTKKQQTLHNMNTNIGVMVKGKYVVYNLFVMKIYDIVVHVTT